MGTTDDALSPLRYKTLLFERFWEYSRKSLSPFDQYFDRSSASTDRPPVFKKENASSNVLLMNSAPEWLNVKVLNTIRPRKRHRWFRSMASSQALTQSVFGNLKARRKLDCLRPLVGDDGKPLFIWEPSHSSTCELEAEVKHLEEKPRGRTSIDVLFDGSYRIAVECKLGETEVGSCSRPRLQPDDPSYKEQFCDGRYKVQDDGASLCPLSKIGVQYWEYIPALFNWSADTNDGACPLKSTYQLVRNLLAVCVSRTRSVSLDSGHVVLLYDCRNPAFHGNGKGIMAWDSVRAALKRPSLMQRCTWQEVVACLRADASLDWLIGGLVEKYGF